MSDELFTLDTNILVHALDAGAGYRHDLAREILAASINVNCRLTLQAVSEFYAVVTRKQVVSPSEAAAQADDYLAAFPVVAASIRAARTALALASTGRASYWDALLIAAAAEAGCKAILTEDLHDGAELQGVRIVHPFATDRMSTAAQALLRG